ncbi:uncharacterized protein SCHCODRAFT_02644468 [Schizophyllum commune H4-8]|nr:uncharacterized protein SCHCODRAFT_02644468 [Schizophyllum commune H4-8]KAI5885336.1 hypothetical protein SCHCODRAFT_02644468 [Schizophyllum commune H4-8]
MMTMRSPTEEHSDSSFSLPLSSFLFLPQELKDAVLHHLASSPTTLAACALTHRTFTPTAQSLLFYTLHVTRASHAPALRRLLHSAPHLAAHPRRLIIADVHTTDEAQDHWIPTAAPDLATVLAALPNLEMLALRCAMTSFPYLGDLRYALRRVVLRLRGLELAGIRMVPPDLVAGGRLASLRLVDVSFAGRAPHSSTACAPEALELREISSGALSPLRLDVRRLTRLRLDAADAAELVPFCASTLRVLEAYDNIPPPHALPALHTLALRSYGPEGEFLRPWLRAAPGLRRLVLRASGGDIRLVDGDLEIGGCVLVSGNVLEEGRALERVELVCGAKHAMRGSTLPKEVRVGVLEGGAEVVRVWVHRPDTSSGEHRVSMRGSDILDG